jgi:hypothetical protein
MTYCLHLASHTVWSDQDNSTSLKLMSPGNQTEGKSQSDNGKKVERTFFSRKWRVSATVCLWMCCSCSTSVPECAVPEFSRFLKKKTCQCQLEKMTCQWRITSLDLSSCRMSGQDEERLVMLLAQCLGIFELDLSGNEIGDEGAGFQECWRSDQCCLSCVCEKIRSSLRYQGVLLQCPRLSLLDLSCHEIGADGEGSCCHSAQSSIICILESIRSGPR